MENSRFATVEIPEEKCKFALVVFFASGMTKSDIGKVARGVDNKNVSSVEIVDSGIAEYIIANSRETVGTL